MIELYYTIVIIGILVGMYFYTRSIPVALFSVYSATWFFPQGIPLYLLNIDINPVIGIFEIIYIMTNYNLITNSSDKRMLSFNTLLIYILSILCLHLVTACFSSKMELDYQIQNIKGIFFVFLNIITVLSFNNVSDFKKYLHFITFLIILSGVYSIYTYINGSNPIGNFIALYDKKFESQGLGSDFISIGRGFLTGRVMGFTVHPLMFGGVIALFAMLILQQLIFADKKYKKGNIVLFIFCIVLIILTGSRSVIISLLLAILFLLACYNLKRTIISIISLMFAFFFFNIVIKDDFITSILYFWSEESTVAGSSYGMRTDQLEACFNAINKDIVSYMFGLGHGWAAHYIQINGNCPPFQGFESILFIKIVNTGILGTILYFLIVYIPIIKIISIYVKNNKEKNFIMSFIICGLTIAFMTGDYYGYRLYVILIFLLIKYYLIRQYTTKPKTMLIGLHHHPLQSNILC